MAFGVWNVTWRSVPDILTERNTFNSQESRVNLTVVTKRLRYFETSGTAHQKTQSHIPDYRNSRDLFFIPNYDNEDIFFRNVGRIHPTT
jgi:hypothetical protein